MIESTATIEKSRQISPREESLLREALGQKLKTEELQIIGDGFFNKVYRYDNTVYKIPKNLTYFGYPSYLQLGFENSIYKSCRLPAPDSEVLPTFDRTTGIIATEFVPDFRPLTLFDTIYDPQIRSQLLGFLELDRVITEGFGCAIDFIDFEAGKLYAANYGLPLSFLLNDEHSIPDMTLSNNLVISPNNKLINIDNGMLWLKDKLHIANQKWITPHTACYQAVHKFMLNPLEDYLKRLN